MALLGRARARHRCHARPGRGARRLLRRQLRRATPVQRPLAPRPSSTHRVHALEQPRTAGPPHRRRMEEGGRGCGTARHAESLARFEAIDAALRRMFGCIASAVVETLSDELDEVVAAYVPGSARRRCWTSTTCSTSRSECSVSTSRSAWPWRPAIGTWRSTSSRTPIRSSAGYCSELAALHPTDDWRKSVPRPGRSSSSGTRNRRYTGSAAPNFDTYAAARDCVARAQPDGLLHVTANFRSRPGILGHVNRCFRGPLSRSMRRAYVELGATIGNREPWPAVHRAADRPDPARREGVRLAGGGGRSGRRRLRDAARTLLLPDGAADQAPRGRRHSPLDARWVGPLDIRAGPPAGRPANRFACGKGFFRRQETQDLVTLARVLAGSRRRTLRSVP